MDDDLFGVFRSDGEPTARTIVVRSLLVGAVLHDDTVAGAVIVKFDSGAHSVRYELSIAAAEDLVVGLHLAIVRARAIGLE